MVTEYLVVGRQVSAHQFVENIVVKWDSFAGAGAFHVLGKIDPGITRATDRAITDSPHDLLELLLPPSTVAWVGERHYLLDEIVTMPISA